MKAYITHEMLNTPEFKLGIPGGWPAEVRETTQLSDAEVVEGWKLCTNTEFADYVAALTEAKASWDAAQTAHYVIPPEVFREQRLTQEERQLIRTLARDNAAIADLWEKLLTLKEGIVSDDPLTTLAKQACVQLFGAERADQLFRAP